MKLWLPPNHGFQPEEALLFGLAHVIKGLLRADGRIRQAKNTISLDFHSTQANMHWLLECYHFARERVANHVVEGLIGLEYQGDEASLDARRSCDA